ncbi:MAG: TonB-dependent receptor, partial [Proteobacteria bacterium]
LPNFIGADQSDSHFSPKLGVVVKLSDKVRLFGNYATGFKAPEPGQINQFFENLAYGYTSLPNPDLGPETSESWEGGIRLNSGGFSLSGTAFKANFDDFISQEVVGGSFTPQDPAQYQFINIDQAEVWGIEAKAEYRATNGITGRLAMAYAKGDQILPDGDTIPLATVDPFNLVFGLGYRDPGGNFGGEVILTHHARKELDQTPTGYARPDAFTILDATAFVRIADMLTLRAGVFNITDEKYAYWSDVIGLSTISDAYTRPGRNTSVSASFRF